VANANASIFQRRRRHRKVVHWVRGCFAGSLTYRQCLTPPPAESESERDWHWTHRRCRAGCMPITALQMLDARSSANCRGTSPASKSYIYSAVQIFGISILLYMFAAVKIHCISPQPAQSISEFEFTHDIWVRWFSGFCKRLRWFCSKEIYEILLRPSIL